MNLFSLVLRQLVERRLRSILTVAGIGIGIAALVSLILLSGSLQSAVTGELERFGSDEILIAGTGTVGTGGPRGTGGITADDVRTVENVPGVLKVIPVVAQTVRVRVGSEERFLTVRGPPPEEAEEFLGLTLQAGRYVQAGERRVAMIGSRIADGYFREEVVLGSRIEVAGDDYRVIGIFEETGTLEQDRIIVVPIYELRESIDQPDAVTAMRAIIAPGQDMTLMEDRITRALERARGDDDFATTTPQEIIDQIGSFLGVINIVVFSIAAVSLLVAGMGIMNSLYTSVLQRTNEIGTMKATGATNRQILLVFLTESALLGLLGGVLGIVLGISGGLVFVQIFNGFGIVRIALDIPPMLVVGSLVFSVVLGVLAGVLPALSAARLNPVDALRHE